VRHGGEGERDEREPAGARPRRPGGHSPEERRGARRAGARAIAAARRQGRADVVGAPDAGEELRQLKARPQLWAGLLHIAIPSDHVAQRAVTSARSASPIWYLFVSYPAVCFRYSSSFGRY